MRALALGGALATACAAPPTGPRDVAPERGGEAPETAGAGEARSEWVEWPAASDAPGPRISRLAGTPKRFDPTQATFEIRFRLDAPADVRVLVADERGETVARIDLGPRQPGDLSASWDGRLGDGERAPAGVYHFRVKARGEDGGIRVAGGDPEFVPEEVIVQRFELDAGTGRVSYVLPKAARVRLRTGLASNLLAGSLFDWHPQQGGRHEFLWDGSDASGLMDLRGDPRLRLHLDAFRLPPNTVILETADEPAGRGRANPSSAGYQHARHDTAYCRDVGFSVELPTASFDDERRVHLLDGVETVRVTLDPALAGHLIDTRFEVLFFVDTTFLFEEEEGSDPINFTLDTTGLAPGPHLLTVNIWGADDHAGVVTLPFVRR